MVKYLFIYFFKEENATMLKNAMLSREQNIKKKISPKILRGGIVNILEVGKKNK